MTLPHRVWTLALIASLSVTGCDCGDGGGGGRGDGGTGGGDGASDDGGVGGGSGGGSGGGAGGGTGADAGVRADVHVVITSDNAYGFGYGSPNALRVYFNGLEAVSANEIFACSASCDPEGPNTCAQGECDAFGSCNDDGLGPETYIVPGSNTNEGDFLYVVTWSDDHVTQGLLGQFAAADGSNVVFTGDEAWTVCATGAHDYDILDGEGVNGPDTAEINTWIANCNQGVAGGSFSKGWLGTTPRDDMALVMGDANLVDGGDDFAPACSDATRGDHIPDDAHWMWFDNDVTTAPDAFHSTGSEPDTAHNPHEFLIFRLGVGEIIIGAG